MPSSPYIERLKQSIEHATDPAVQGVDRATLAGCYARHGDFELAEAEIASLRAQFGDGRSGRVSIMIMSAEAQLIYYKDLGERARDRMMRAQLLSVAGRDAALSALTSAWLAHICFNLHRHEEMTRSIKTCLDTVSRDDHEAAGRLALTLGDAFYAAEQPEIGNRWYTKAHERAVKLGDHSVIAALTYNRAAMGVFHARIEAADADITPSALAKLTGEVRTAANYQAIAQLTSLQPLLDYALASVHILGQKYSEAAALLLPMMLSGPSTSPLERSAALSCDLALCLAKSGNLEQAREQLSSIRQEAVDKLTPDDRLVALSAIRSSAEACGHADLVGFAIAGLPEARREYSAAVSKLRENLQPFSDSTVLERL